MRLVLALAFAATGALPLASVSAASAAPAAAARPSREPSMAAAPAWVVPVEMARPDSALAERPAQILLSNSQSRYRADGIEHYVHIAYQIQNVQGLQELGNIALPWSPEHADLIVHGVRIIRGGTVIDLLANGQEFTVLRRENNLQSATLDGVLTAVMQPEGLAVGDILSISWTIRQRGGALPVRAENLFMVAGNQPVRRLNIRQIWPDSFPLQWRATGAFEHAAVRRTAGGSELSVELTDAQAPDFPAQLPERLKAASTLQISQFRDWAEIGAMLAPHFEQAVQLPPNSPLRAEIARIAAESEDPRVRTMSALRLVQDQVRYFALLMADGNYLPATADRSWARRYADCKGKSVLLVAVLRGLGIEAETVAVNTGGGEAIAERLPILPMFNHMIVRARIGGTSYWLDGTRTGDRNLDELAVSTLGWGLPVRTGGAALEQIRFGPPPLPLEEYNVTYDASGGLDGSVPTRREMIVRGSSATQMRFLIAQMGREAYLRQMRDSMNRNGEGDREFTIDTIDLRDDAEDGAITLVMTGTGEMRWNPIPGSSGSGPRRMRLDSAFETTLDVDRPEGPFRDAPIALQVPHYIAATQTVILPDGLGGVTVEGEDLQRTVAGTLFTRRIEQADGRVSVRTAERRVAREISAAEARDSADALRALREQTTYVRAPSSALRTAARGR